MQYDKIVFDYQQLTVPKSGYSAIKEDAEGCYYGKDAEGNIVFIVPSAFPKLQPIVQETASLKLFFNLYCSISIICFYILTQH